MLAALALSLAKALFGFAESRSNVDLERFRIQAGIDTAEIEAKVQLGAQAASVIQSGMMHRAFWIAWSIAAIPTSLWFGWGMLDSTIMNGTLLPDVAALPVQLKGYADMVFGNIFYAGAAGVGIESGAKVIAAALRR